METIYFLAGLLFLVLGAELLVRGSSKLAGRFGISPLVIGLTVVAFGTSAPEAAVSVGAVFQGNNDISVGNVIGSNIFNILCILGISALISPIKISQQVVKKETPLMILVSVVMLLCALDGKLGRIDGLLFLLGISIYTVWTIRSSQKEPESVKVEYSEHFKGVRTQKGGLLFDAAYILIGLVLLVFGSRLTITGASEIARFFGISDLIIGLTVVAAGTSLPELATSLVAAVRKESDIAVGNVIGSNIFNILGILGLSALVAPQGLVLNVGLIKVDLAIMIIAALLCLPFFFTKLTLTRFEGAAFLSLYIGYLAYLVLTSMGWSF